MQIDSQNFSEVCGFEQNQKQNHDDDLILSVYLLIVYVPKVCGVTTTFIYLKSRLSGRDNEMRKDLLRT